MKEFTVYCSLLFSFGVYCLLQFFCLNKVLVFRDIYLYLNCSKFLLPLGFISAKWAAFSFLLRLCRSCIEWLFKPKLFLIKLSHFNSACCVLVLSFLFKPMEPPPPQNP
jgi:hypothetical protein